jgi:hypothetical protein
MGRERAHLVRGAFETVDAAVAYGNDISLIEADLVRNCELAGLERSCN